MNKIYLFMYIYFVYNVVKFKSYIIIIYALYFYSGEWGSGDLKKIG